MTTSPSTTRARYSPSRRSHATRRPARAIPCVAVTAFAAEQDRRRALAAGFDAYISKPFRSKDLLELVARLLAERRDGDGDGMKTHDGQNDGSR